MRPPGFSSRVEPRAHATCARPPASRDAGAYPAAFGLAAATGLSCGPDGGSAVATAAADATTTAGSAHFGFGFTSSSSVGWSPILRQDRALPVTAMCRCGEGAENDRQDGRSPKLIRSPVCDQGLHGREGPYDRAVCAPTRHPGEHRCPPLKLENELVATETLTYDVFINEAPP